MISTEKAKSIGIPITTVFDTMQSTFGCLYANDFTQFEWTYWVSLSCKAAFRETPGDLRHALVRVGPARSARQTIAAKRNSSRRSSSRMLPVTANNQTTQPEKLEKIVYERVN